MLPSFEKEKAPEDFGASRHVAGEGMAERAWFPNAKLNAAAMAAQQRVEEGRVVLAKRASKNLCVGERFLL